MLNRNAVVWSTVAAGTLLSLWACSHHESPSAPSAAGPAAQAASEDEGGPRKVLASAFPVGPSSGPVGPSSGPVGPSTRPVGPGQGPVGPSPTGIGPSGGGQPPPSGGNCGNGPGVPCPPGGGSQPSTAPSGGGGACSTTTQVFDSTDTPIVLTGAAGSVSTLIVPPAPPGCTIKPQSMRVKFYAVAPSLAALSNLRAFVQLARGGQSIAASDLFRLSSAVQLVGTQIGSGCPTGGSPPSTFVEGGDTFPGAPPYDGTYNPFGLLGFPGFTNFDDRAPDGDWRFGMTFAGASAVTLNCWRLEYQLQ